jgi:mono/diheme cytochrome c family protein
VLAVFAFVAFWVIVALGLFFIASRGGLGGARQAMQTRTRSGALGLNLVLVVVYAAFGIAVPLLILTGNHSNASAQVGGIKLNASEKAGRELFGEHCGVCHTLAASNSVGKVGPNLDQIMPSESLVAHTITNGCLPNPPASESSETCLGQGVMPANVLQGKQAQQVAAFVSKVAGKE